MDPSQRITTHQEGYGLEKPVSSDIGRPRRSSKPQEELERSFSLWSLGALLLCLLATWEALGTVVAQALISGGAPCLFYNYIISFLGTMFIVVSLAEIASMYPTAGGQYHWVAVMAPTSQRLPASWFTAWINIGGQVVFTASAAFASGLQLQALVTLNHPDSYIPERWQGMLYYDLILLISVLVNIYGSKILPITNNVAGVIHILGFLVIVIVLGVMAPKHDAHYVFVETSNTSGWENNGIAWLVGFLSVLYPFLGYDAATHLSEELPNPRKNVPLAMVGSVAINGVLGFIYCIALLFSLGDLDQLLVSPTGFPFIQLFYNTTGSYAGASILTLLPTFVAAAANSAALTSTSRTWWSFARDDAVPGSKYFSYVDPNLRVPVRMVILVTFLEFLLGFIYLGNTTAFNAILSMAILGLYLSYLLPIVYMLLYGRKGEIHTPGYFKLGRFGPVVNVVATLWLVFAIFFSTWPSFYPVTAVNMNYSTVVLGGWTLFGAIYYAVWGRHSYQGPLIEMEDSTKSPEEGHELLAYSRDDNDDDDEVPL